MARATASTDCSVVKANSRRLFIFSAVR
jgi:hypothetical protein